MTLTSKDFKPVKIKLITTATDLNHYGFKQLERSLKHFDWDFEVLGGKYVAFGSKMVNAYNYAKTTDASHLFIVDAYDVFVLGTMSEALGKIGELNCIMFNAEKAAWPYAEWAIRYPEVPYQWKYLNGGAAFVETDLFVKMFEENPIHHEDNDQVNLARTYLTNRTRYNFKLDTNCDVFQSVAFQNPDDFTYENNRLQNTKTKTQPVIIHDNGHGGFLQKVYPLI